MSAGGGPASVGGCGVTGLGWPTLVSGASVVAVLIPPWAASFPVCTCSVTAPLTDAAPPDFLNSSASLRFFGVISTIFATRAALKPARSKGCGSWASILPTWAAEAWLATSFGGPMAAACASAALRFAELL